MLCYYRAAQNTCRKKKFLLTRKLNFLLSFIDNSSPQQYFFLFSLQFIWVCDANDFFWYHNMCKNMSWKFLLLWRWEMCQKKSHITENVDEWNVDKVVERGKRITPLEIWLWFWNKRVKWSSWALSIFVFFAKHQIIQIYFYIVALDGLLSCALKNSLK